MSSIKDDWTVWAIRSLLVGMSSIILGVVSYMGNQITGKLDKHDTTLSKLEYRASTTDSTVSLIQQEMVLRRQQQDTSNHELRDTVADHETRIRSVERKVH